MSAVPAWRAFEELPSTNDTARDWLAQGAPHGAVITADRQTAGRGRQGRSWVAPAGALALSMVVRDGLDGLLPLRAGLAVAQVAGSAARVKWPNDVLIDGRKVAGVLVELVDDAGAPAAIVGIGVNVAVDPLDLPPAVAARATTLDLPPAQLRPFAASLSEALLELLTASSDEIVRSLAARDALAGQHVRWAGGEGQASGIDRDGRLMVRGDDGELHQLSGGEVHLL